MGESSDWSGTETGDVPNVVRSANSMSRSLAVARVAKQVAAGRGANGYMGSLRM